MTLLRRAVIVFLGWAVVLASVALLATVPTGKAAGTIWPLHSHNLAAWLGMLMAWMSLGLALVFLLIWLIFGEGERPKDDPVLAPVKRDSRPFQSGRR